MLFLLLFLRTSLIVLNSTNFVELSGEIDEENINGAIKHLTYSKSNLIYLYINTNGGEFESGLRFIHILDSYDNKKNIICIGEKVLSTGFSIFQACKKRVVMLSSTAMQHQMIISLEGQLYTLMRKLEYLKYIDDYLITHESKRLERSKEIYKSLKEHEWWLHGRSIVEKKAADIIQKVICDRKLSKILMSTLLVSACFFTMMSLF